MIRWMLLLLLCVARGATESEGLGRRDGMEGRGGAGRCVRACGDSEGRDWICGWDYVVAVRAQAEEGLRRTRKGVGTLETDELLLVCWRARL